MSKVPQRHPSAAVRALEDALEAVIMRMADNEMAIGGHRKLIAGLEAKLATDRQRLSEFSWAIELVRKLHDDQAKTEPVANPAANPAGTRKPTATEAGGFIIVEADRPD